MKAFNPEVVVGWSSGTGFAGVFGASYYLLMKCMNINYKIFLASLIIAHLVYYWSFKRLETLKTR